MKENILMLDKKTAISFIICKISKLVLLIERPLFKLNNKLYDYYYKINTPKADPKAEKWANIHKDLTEKEGFDPNSDKYYSEIDRRLYKRYKKRYLKHYSHNN